MKRKLSPEDEERIRKFWASCEFEPPEDPEAWLEMMVKLNGPEWLEQFNET